jgi:hypothetical protein
LDKQSIKYEVKGPWIDNQSITKKHQKHFRAIFHEQSELIMKTDHICDTKDLKDEIWFLADRMIHCFLNNCYYIAEPWKDEARLNSSWENTIMSQLSSGRTNYNKDIAKQLLKVNLRDYGVNEVGYKSSRES